MIGWLLDTNVTAEIISAGGAARVKAWAAKQDEATLYLSILTIAEYDKGIANLPDGDLRRPAYMTTRDSLAARFAGAPASRLGRDRAALGYHQRHGAARHRPPASDHRYAARRNRAAPRPLSGDAERPRCAPQRRRRLQPMGG